jgi:predicted Zn-dependent peptidase
MVTVVSAFDRRDCRTVFTFLPLSRTGSLTWASLAVLLECIQSRVYSRLRHREGLSYSIWTNVRWAGDAVVVELTASTLPSGSQRALTATIEELRNLSASGIDANLFARAQLEASRQAFLTLGDAADAFEALRFMALFGDPPDDPIQAIQSVDREQCNALLRECLHPGKEIVSVCGPILEEESESLSRVIQARD